MMDSFTTGSSHRADR